MTHFNQIQLRNTRETDKKNPTKQKWREKKRENKAFNLARHFGLVTKTGTSFVQVHTTRILYEKPAPPTKSNVKL